jgi:nucleotide-binding universal stress UspA family protein
MIRSILVPLDGSPFAEHALPYALAVARRAGARVEVAHAHPPPDPARPDWPRPPPERSDPESLAGRRAYLDGVARRLTAAGAAASAALLEGPTALALCRRAEEGGADLVVMTTHGRGPLSRLWLGGVADALLRHLTTPLLLVRPCGLPTDLTAEPPLRRALVALDGSANAEAALGPALELGAALGADFTLLRVVPPPPVLGWEVPGYPAQEEADRLAARRREAARNYLEGVAAQVRAAGARAHGVAVVHQSAADAILGAASAGDVDWVALGTRGRGGVARWLLGSVADRVVRGAAVPVLVCCAAAPQAREERARETNRRSGGEPAPATAAG